MVTRRGDMIVLGNDEVRIERGPKRVTAVATEELLADSRTAPHYYAGTRTINGEERVGIDADGKPIVLGEEMTYLEWGGSEEGVKHTYYIYQKEDVSTDENTKESERWKEVATRATEESAIEYGQKLIGE